MKPYLLIVALLTLAATKGEKSERVPAIEAWIQEVSTKLDELSSAVPLTMAAVKNAGGDSFRQIDGINREKFRNMSYLRFLSSTDVDWNSKINAPFLKGKRGIDLVFNSTGANILFVGSAKQSYLVLGGKQKKPTSATMESIKTDPALFVSEVFRALGYDGVVLDKKDSFYLVGLHVKAIGRVGTQALALKNSENKFIVSDHNADGAALLNSVSVKDGFGIFKVLLKGDGSEIPIGTKIISEKSNR